jgi:ketosteroid isomerase-like protein
MPSTIDWMEAQRGTMKPNGCILWVCLFLIPAGVSAHERRPSPDAQAQIRTLLEGWTQAIEKRDLDGVMSAYLPSDELTVYDGIPPLAYRGPDSLRNNFRQFFSRFSGRLNIEYRDLHIVAGPTVAFAYGLQKISGTLANGSQRATWVRFTQGYRHIRGRWYAVHDHVSVPADPMTGKALYNLTP